MIVCPFHSYYLYVKYEAYEGWRLRHGGFMDQMNSRTLQELVSSPYQYLQISVDASYPVDGVGFL